MKYLFFDIELASSIGNNCRICSLGYLIADENLDIIKSQEDIVINPSITNDEWDWRVLRTMLAYSKKFIESHPTFPHFYNKFKGLFEDKDTLVCGFSVKDDVGYLTDEFVRYNLEAFHYNFFDVQGLHNEFKEDGIKGGLTDAYIHWCNKLPGQAHRSDDDAFSTYSIAKAICKIKKKTFAELIEGYKNYYGKAEGLKIGFINEELLSKAELKERSAIRKAEREKQLGKRVSVGGYKFRELKPEFSDFILKGSVNELLLLRLLDNCKPEVDRDKIFEGKKISFSLNYEMYNFQNTMKLVQMICDCGGEYVKKASIANIFVKYSHQVNGEDRRCSKLDYVLKAIDEGGNIQIIEFEEFLDMLGLDEEGLNSIPSKNYDYLLEDKYKKGQKSFAVDTEKGTLGDLLKAKGIDLSSLNLPDDE